MEALQLPYRTRLGGGTRIADNAHLTLLKLSLAPCKHLPTKRQYTTNPHRP